MSWYSPNMAASSSRTPREPRDPLDAPGLDPAAIPSTPPGVPNLTPNTCLALVEFKDLLRQYRQVDDTVTTRLNRHLARWRDSGHIPSPSLLSSTVPLSASSASDLGQSTYAHVPNEACAQFWSQLLHVWQQREDIVRYCLNVADFPSPSPSSQRGDAEARLDADYKPKLTPFASTSRGEENIQFLKRQLRNELAVESIIRKRSLDAFKSRCRAFRPQFAQGAEGERQRAMWLGNDTPEVIATVRSQAGS
ncbi:hypothetical protein ACQY0O_006807 [Thecaphora frezii]